MSTTQPGASACAAPQDGVYGVKILGYGMSSCIFGSGFITYSLIGFFGATCFSIVCTMA